MDRVKTYEWWIDWEDVAEMLQRCLFSAHSIYTYLIETFNLEVPCKIILRPIVEGV